MSRIFKGSYCYLDINDILNDKEEVERKQNSILWIALGEFQVFDRWVISPFSEVAGWIPVPLQQHVAYQ